MEAQREMKSDYQNNGYCTVECLFSVPEIDKLHDLMYSLAPPDYGAIINPDRADFLIAQSLNPSDSLGKRVDKIEKCHEAAKVFRKLMKNSRIVDTIQDIHGKKMVGLSSHMLFKQPNSPYAGQAWVPHQDNSYAQNPNGELITVNVFFSDVFPENGTLYLYPKSHKLGLLEHEFRKSYGENISPGNRAVLPDGLEKVDIYAVKGDVLFMNGNCVHGSYANTTELPRPMFSATYIAEGEEFLPGFNTRRKVIDLCSEVS